MGVSSVWHGSRVESSRVRCVRRSSLGSRCAGQAERNLIARAHAGTRYRCRSQHIVESGGLAVGVACVSRTCTMQACWRALRTNSYEVPNRTEQNRKRRCCNRYPRPGTAPSSTTGRPAAAPARETPWGATAQHYFVNFGWSKCIVACLVLTVVVAAAWLAVLALLQCCQ